MITPASIDDLRLCAESDLNEPKRGVVLKWAMWHALAAGARRKAERAADMMDKRAWDTWCRASSCTTTNASMLELVMASGPKPEEVQRAADTVAEAVAFETACGNVLELLKKRTAQPKAAQAAKRAA